MTKENTPTCTRPVSIAIISKQTEAGNAEMFQDIIDTFEDEVDLSGMFENEATDETIEIRSQGTLTYENGRLTVSYDETELTGMEGATTTVFFDTGNPGVVTMLRYGSVSTALVFEKGKRHICAYNTPYMPFEICIFTRKIENTLTVDGGSIDLDYLIEIHGAKAERTLFSLRVTVQDEQ